VDIPFQLLMKDTRAQTKHFIDEIGILCGIMSFGHDNHVEPLCILGNFPIRSARARKVLKSRREQSLRGQAYKHFAKTNQYLACFTASKGRA
jgi:hypothetical protein